MISPVRLGLFGGTFDPVHEGHLAIAAEAKSAARLDKVVMLPARQSPHKSDRRSSATDAERVEMLRRATCGLEWVEVSDWELRQPPPSYSWKTALHFRDCHPDARLFWILGADQWAVLGDWAEPGILRGSLDFLVFPRHPFPPPSPRPGWRAEFLQTVHPANATAIRADLAKGVSRPPHLPAAIQTLAGRIYGPPVSSDKPAQSADDL